MKRILVTMTSMYIGGAERSLIGLLSAIDYTKYQVDLLLYRHEGEFLPFIPRQVRILPYMPQYDTLDRPIKNLLCSRRFLFGFARLFAKLRTRLYCKKHSIQKTVWVSLQNNTRCILPLLPKIKGTYDVAIGFLGIHAILVKKVTAKIKLGWIHTDYGQLAPNPKMDRQVYDRLDYIVNVSQECTNIFVQQYPQYKKKAITVENILSPAFVRQQARQLDVSKEMDLSGKYKLLCSVGRFTKEKNFDNVPDICRRMLAKGCNVKWYIIGYGADEQLIKEKIRQCGVERHVILLGKKIKPYPYIEGCDLYVQPSRAEGKAVTVREAQMLCKPVAIANFATARSQLTDGVDGMIVPMDNDGCARALVELLGDPEGLRRLCKNCAQTDYSNRAEVEKIYRLEEKAL